MAKHHIEPKCLRASSHCNRPAFLRASVGCFVFFNCISHAPTAALFYFPSNEACDHVALCPLCPFSSYRSNKPAPRNSLCAPHFETAAPHWTPSALARAFFEAAPKMEPTNSVEQFARHLKYRAGRMPAPLPCSWRPPYSRRPTSGLAPSRRTSSSSRCGLLHRQGPSSSPSSRRAMRS